MVSVYLADDTAECPISDRLSIPLIRLFGGTVLAENDRMAAARVWFDQVVRFRKQRLEARGFILDNGVEVWLIGTSGAM